MRFSFPINAESTSPLREVVVFAGLTIALSWLFWLPGAFLVSGSGSALGDMLLALGSLVPLAVAIFLEVWLREFTLNPLQWLKNLTLRALLVAIVVPIILLIPMLLMRMYEGTVSLTGFVSTALDMAPSLVGLLFLSLAEEVGWRAYLLPRVKFVPVYMINVFVGIVWFLWQLPLTLGGRYNSSEDFGSYLVAMFLYALLITPFLNRLALTTRYSPIFSAILRAGLGFSIAVYFAQGRADPLTDTFGLVMIAWLAALNLILFSQLWQGKKPPAQISELERVMPLETV